MPRGKKAQSTKRAQEEEPEKTTDENPKTEQQNDEESLKKRKILHAPTVHAIVTDSLTHLSLQHWASAGKDLIHTIIFHVAILTIQIQI